MAPTPSQNDTTLEQNPELFVVNDEATSPFPVPSNHLQAVTSPLVPAKRMIEGCRGLSRALEVDRLAPISSKMIQHPSQYQNDEPNPTLPSTKQSSAGRNESIGTSDRD